MIGLRKAIIGILLAIVVLSAAAPALGQAQSQKNLYQAAQDDGSFKTLLTAADSAGFKSTLVTGGPYTILAPTDDAFKKVPAGTLGSLVADKPKLTSVIKNHIITGKHTAAEMVSMGKVRTLDGKELKVTKASDGSVTIGNAKIVKPDIQASNGVIQGV
ncbi:MAG TPA: fasciclin domain-containing protein, partial [Methanocellaceae archaeon]